jgi:tetratricopeptide (TPR) repeat protein
VVAAALIGCASPEERFAEQLARAERLAAEGSPEEAILVYQNALKLEPESAEVYERIGHLHRAQGRFADALSYYRQAFRLDETRLSAAMHEARLLAFSDPVRAHELVVRGLREAPDLALVHVAGSQLALAQGRTRRALAEARRAVQLAPEDDAAWVQLGTVQQARIRERQRRGRAPTSEMFESAIAAFERVDRLRGGDPRALVERARTLGAWGRHAEAVAAYKAAIELAILKGSALDAAAAAWTLEAYASERRDSGLRRYALRQVVAAKPDEYQAWDQLARLVGLRRGHSADEVYRQLLDQRPEDPQAHALFARHLVREGREGEAATHLERTLEEEFEHPALWDQLLRVRIGQGRFADARAAWARMAREFPDDRVTHVAEARLAVAEGRYDEGIRILTGLTKWQEEVEPLRLLALAHHRRGDVQEARQVMDRLLALSPRPSPSLLRLDAQIDHASGDFAGVLRNLATVADRGEELLPEERVLVATALYETGRAPQGRALLEEMLAEPDAPPDAVLEYARLEATRDPERVQRALGEAHARNPRVHAVLEALTHLEVERGQVQEALARLDALVAARQAGPRTLLLRARLLRDTGALERAEADVLRAFEADPALAGAVDLLFDIYRAQGRLAEARRSFEQAEVAGVLHPGARLLLARLCLAEGETARARDLLQQVLRDQPGRVEARRDLALVLALRGEDLDRALELAREAETASGQRPDTVDAVGFVHLRAGRSDDALASFRRALALAAERPDGREPTYHYHEGLALRALGREAQAVAAFQRALGHGGEFPEAEDARRELEAARQGFARTPKPS